LVVNVQPTVYGVVPEVAVVYGDTIAISDGADRAVFDDDVAATAADAFAAGDTTPLFAFDVRNDVPVAGFFAEEVEAGGGNVEVKVAVNAEADVGASHAGVPLGSVDTVAAWFAAHSHQAAFTLRALESACTTGVDDVTVA
jgi:hypothetical protein